VTPNITLPISCGPGTYSPKGASQCSLCLATYYGSDYALGGAFCSGECLAPIGSYCPEGSSSSAGSLCPPGYTCAGLQNLTVPCPAGKYQSSYGQYFCVNATPGYYAQSAAASQSPCTCLGGYFCPASWPYAFSPSAGAGTGCPAGQACLGGTSLPTNCTPGSYSVGYQQFCSLCPMGTFGNTSQLLTRKCTANCTLPAPGKYCPEGTTADFSGATCSAGYFCQGGGAPMLECPVGYYSSANSAVCVPCSVPAGYFCGVRSTADVGIVCPEGLYCAGATATPVSLKPAPGRYLPTQSSTFTAVDCPAGTYCPSTSDNSNACPSYANCTSTDGLYYTKKTCLQGYGSPAGSAGPCIGCAASAGSYCPAGSAVVGAAVVTALCPVGTFCATGGLLSPTSCTIANVPAGKYCALGSSADTGVNCPAGSACGGGSSAPSLCSIGYYSSAGASQCSACGGCGANYCAAGSTSSSPSTPCPSGYYCTEYCSPIICSPGTYCSSGSWNYCTAGT